jgi:hypothetical protein
MGTHDAQQFPGSVTKCLPTMQSSIRQGRALEQSGHFAQHSPSGMSGVPCLQVGSLHLAVLQSFWHSAFAAGQGVVVQGGTTTLQTLFLGHLWSLQILHVVHPHRPVAATCSLTGQVTLGHMKRHTGCTGHVGQHESEGVNAVPNVHDVGGQSTAPQLGAATHWLYGGGHGAVVHTGVCTLQT